MECEQTSCLVKKVLTKQGFNIPQELLKYLKQQNLSPVPLLPAMQEIQGNMDDSLSRNDLWDDEKARRYFQLRNKYLAFKEKLNSRTRPQEITRTVLDLTSSTQDSSTATTAFSTPLHLFNVTPKLTQAAILQKLEKESSTPPQLRLTREWFIILNGGGDLMTNIMLRKSVFSHCENIRFHCACITQKIRRLVPEILYICTA